VKYVSEIELCEPQYDA